MGGHHFIATSIIVGAPKWMLCQVGILAVVSNTLKHIAVLMCLHLGLKQNLLLQSASYFGSLCSPPEASWQVKGCISANCAKKRQTVDDSTFVT